MTGPRRRRGRPFVAAVAAVAALAVASACTRELAEPPVLTNEAPASTGTSAPDATDPDPTTPGTTDEATPGGADAFAPDPAVWSTCSQSGLECATVAVPLDHDRPEGDTIDLSLIRVPASGPDPIGSIFVNPGGPGGSGVEFVAGGFRFDAAVAERYHLVGFDPRGVGESSPLTCRFDYGDGPLPDAGPDDPAEEAALDAWASELADRCAATDGDLLPHVGTEDVVSDLEVLRRAVGDERFHFYGFSYGTLLGARYADRYPERVGHVVLDGVVDPSIGLTGLLTQQAEAFERSLAAMDAACGSTLDCPPGGMLAAFDELAATLEQGPVGDVGPTELSTATAFAGYADTIWPALAGAFTSALSGDFSTVEALSDSYYDFGAFSLYVAVECIDSPRPEDPDAWQAFTDDLESRAPRLGAGVASELRPCAHWPVDPSDEQVPLPVASGAPPIVVVGTTGDPATPFGNAERVAGSLESGVLVTHEGNVHTAYSVSACVRALVSDYFVTDQAPDPGTVCD